MMLPAKIFGELPMCPWENSQSNGPVRSSLSSTFIAFSPRTPLGLWASVWGLPVGSVNSCGYRIFSAFWNIHLYDCPIAGPISLFRSQLKYSILRGGPC